MYILDVILCRLIELLMLLNFSSNTSRRKSLPFDLLFRAFFNRSYEELTYNLCSLNIHMVKWNHFVTNFCHQNNIVADKKLIKNVFLFSFELDRYKLLFSKIYW